MLKFHVIATRPSHVLCVKIHPRVNTHRKNDYAAFMFSTLNRGKEELSFTLK